MRRRFSTADLSEGDPVDFWREWLSNEFLPVNLEGYETRGFRAECELTAIGELEISTFRGTSQSVVRPQSLIRPSHADVYVAALAGTQAFDHNGHNAACDSGDIVLFDATRPYVIAHGSNVDVMCVVIPRKLLDQALGVAGVAAGLVLDGRSASARINRDFFRSLSRNAETLGPTTAKRVAATGVELIAAGFAEVLALDLPKRASQVAIVMRARAFIEDNISDPGLDVPRIAAAVHVSPRRLYELFAAEQVTVTDYVWERRLVRARRMLADQAGFGMTIGTIAYLTGFTSPAHFARRFKARFGLTPSDFRAEAHRL